LGEQKARFPEATNELPTRAPLSQIVFEAVNFTDGKRTAADIRVLLSVEFNQGFDEAWMERLVGILEKLNLVK